MPIDQQRLQTDQSYRADLRNQGYFVGSEGGKVYAEAGAGNQGGGGGSASSGPAPAPVPPGGQGANLSAAQLLLNQAQQAAYQACLSARLNLDTDDLAFKKATQAFQNTISVANTTGYYEGNPTLEREKFQAGTATDYLKLISGLRGPADYGQYLRVLGSTPGGLRDLVSSAAGKYAPGAGASTGVAPTPVTL